MPGEEAKMSTLEIANKLVALCREGRSEECQQTLYAQDIVSVEAGAPPGGQREARGLEAIKAKSKWWRDNHEIHSAEISDPYPGRRRPLWRSLHLRCNAEVRGQALQDG